MRPLKGSDPLRRTVFLAFTAHGFAMLFLRSCLVCQLALAYVPSLALAVFESQFQASSRSGSYHDNSSPSTRYHKAFLRRHLHNAAGGAGVNHGNKVPLNQILPKYRPHDHSHFPRKNRAHEANIDDASGSGAEVSDQAPYPPSEAIHPTSKVSAATLPTPTSLQMHLPQHPPVPASMPALPSFGSAVPDPPVRPKPELPSQLSTPEMRKHTCSVLSKIYFDMNGPNWIVNYGWATGASSSSVPIADTSSPVPGIGSNGADDCCAWYGVTCKGPAVVSLDLGRNGLSGPLSSSVFSLAELERLNLSSNALGGSLPPTFDALRSLKNLDLSNTSLTGSIPSSLSSHSVLSTLHLSNNQLTGTADFSAPKLVNLLLDNNHFDGLTIESTASLVRLTANDNQMVGSLPDLSSATGLQIFNVAGNYFTGPLFDLSRLQELYRLDVRYNQLTGPFPSNISALSHLTTFIISSNQFSGPFPSTLSPPSLKTCSVLPNNVQVVPPVSVLADTDSLANRCGVKAPGGADPPAGTPASVRRRDAQTDGTGTNVQIEGRMLESLEREVATSPGKRLGGLQRLGLGRTTRRRPIAQ
ncbi:uncharacterized protein EI90DRAFT_3089509 [Cantharellus anzutake]|uniref:uncharacterized protein n=1 Tax=Cantharellus anzutake TaxID=1750568 RepID=UPI00190498D2|nr:uncharacterized protein EI90DRAFT_3089509 [Cantharellus anzutake]KAF8314813.1 hypothetical protein EI90DRAFT_3089509 [Cantharellus anzutake]